MSRESRENRGNRGVLILDRYHGMIVLCSAAVFACLLIALLLMENRRLSSEASRAFRAGVDRGRIESVEKMVLQLDLRLQTAEVALGLRSEVEENLELDDMEKP